VSWALIHILMNYSLFTVHDLFEPAYWGFTTLFSSPLSHAETHQAAPEPVDSFDTRAC
jgi:hypothetical protein